MLLGMDAEQHHFVIGGMLRCTYCVYPTGC